MIEEPYRWLDAIGNRREYVREQLKGGAPVFGVSLPAGLLLLGVGIGRSKVFELYDRQALAGLGHPADIEKVRQAAIDAAHLEAFSRAPEDVTLRRLVSFGLSPQLKTSFEQIFNAPILVELLLAEVAPEAADDLLMRLHFDGSFEVQFGGVQVAASQPGAEAAAAGWLRSQLKGVSHRSAAAERLLEAWWRLETGKTFTETLTESESRSGWQEALADRTLEIGWLARDSGRRARFEPLTRAELGL
jgi:proteasome alpha subunit